MLRRQTYQQGNIEEENVETINLFLRLTIMMNVYVNTTFLFSTLSIFSLAFSIILIYLRRM